MRKIKVVHIVEALGGGVYTYFKDLTHFYGQESQKKLIDTYVIYSSKRKEIIPENIQKEFSNQVHLIEIDMVKELSPIKDFKSVLSLRKLIKEINPDVLHLHSSKAGVLGRVANFLLFKKRKVYYTPHGYAFLRLDISKNKRSLYHFIEKYSQRIFGGTTIACGDTENEIALEMGESVLIRNGINIEKIKQRKTIITNQRLTIGTVGRITYQKNPQLFNEIALKFPQYDFLWIGDGELKNFLTSSNITITGWFPNNEAVFPYLNKLDVFLQTSLWEGLPLAVLEAMALSKPVIATKVIGNKDIVVHGETGFLFENVSELMPFFQELENLEFRTIMGEKAFERCNQYFNLQTNFQGLSDLYIKS